MKESAVDSRSWEVDQSAVMLTSLKARDEFGLQWSSKVEKVGVPGDVEVIGRE
jgi:hypothetical protein